MAIEVLVVDDGEDWLLLTRVTLRAAGLVVTGAAGSGPEALALIDQLDPAVVVLDEKLPGMSGLETARLILERIAAAAGSPDPRARDPWPERDATLFAVFAGARRAHRRGHRHDRRLYRGGRTVAPPARRG